MFKKFPNAHKTKLEQLNSIRQEHSSTLEMAQMVPGSQSLVPDLSLEGNKPGIDDMFKNLGLSSYDSTNKNVKVSTPNNAMGNQQQSEKAYSKPSSMSLEEKKTLSWNQDQQRKWNSQGQGEPLVPSRDPTTSLIESNLRGLGSTNKSMDSFSSLNLTTSTNYIPNNWSSNFGPPTTLQQPHSFVGNFQPPNSSFQQPNSLVGGYASLASSPPQQVQRPTFQSNSPASLDLRSLDSLLPNMGPRNTPTLAQLSSGTKDYTSSIPLIPSPPRYSAPANNLAKSELEDLLG